MRVAHVARDQPVAVESDDGDVEDGGGAAEHVGRDPHVAHDAAEPPVAARHLVEQAERQHDQRHQQVGARQRHDQAVRQRAHLAEQHDGEDDERVADDDRHDEEGEQHPLEYVEGGHFRRTPRRGGVRPARRVHVRTDVERSGGGEAGEEREVHRCRVGVRRHDAACDTGAAVTISHRDRNASRSITFI